MQLEMMNIFHLYLDNRVVIIRANMTKKQLQAELDEHIKEKGEFIAVMFRSQVNKKGYKFYFEQS